MSSNTRRDGLARNCSAGRWHCPQQLQHVRLGGGPADPRLARSGGACRGCPAFEGAAHQAAFSGRIDRYSVGDLVFTDAVTDAMSLERSVARVSTDVRRNYVFHVFAQGKLSTEMGMQQKRSAANSVQGIVVFDMDQPFRHRAFRVPRVDDVRAKSGRGGHVARTPMLFMAAWSSTERR